MSNKPRRKPKGKGDAPLKRSSAVLRIPIDLELVRQAAWQVLNQNWRGEEKPIAWLKQNVELLRRAHLKSLGPLLNVVMAWSRDEEGREKMKDIALKRNIQIPSKSPLWLPGDGDPK